MQIVSRGTAGGLVISVVHKVLTQLSPPPTLGGTAREAPHVARHTQWWPHATCGSVSPNLLVHEHGPHLQQPAPADLQLQAPGPPTATVSPIGSAPLKATMPGTPRPTETALDLGNTECKGPTAHGSRCPWPPPSMAPTASGPAPLNSPGLQAQPPPLAARTDGPAALGSRASDCCLRAPSPMWHPNPWSPR